MEANDVIFRSWENYLNEHPDGADFLEYCRMAIRHAREWVFAKLDAMNTTYDLKIDPHTPFYNMNVIRRGQIIVSKHRTSVPIEVPKELTKIVDSKFCPKCGKPVNPYKYCIYCGIDCT
jgi:hypothetical protein